MQVDSYETLFFLALAYKSKEQSERELARQEATRLLEKFENTGQVPDYIESFLIDVLTEKIPVFDSRGRQIHRKGK